MLLFQKRFYAAIAAGTKTTTVRRWRRRQVRPGSVHTVPWLGRLAIESVEPVELADLSAEDAAADGFESLSALRAVLAELYAPDAPGRWYRVRFRYLGPRAEG